MFKTIIIMILITVLIGLTAISQFIRKKLKTRKNSTNVKQIIENMNKMEKSLGQCLQERGEDVI